MLTSLSASGPCGIKALVPTGSACASPGGQVRPADPDGDDFSGGVTVASEVAAYSGTLDGTRFTWRLPT
jgi:hypothetical protein